MTDHGESLTRITPVRWIPYCWVYSAEMDTHVEATTPSIALSGVAPTVRDVPVAHRNVRQ